MKILDCTLRDGGYYTNWDFSQEITEVYFKSFNTLPVDYLEVGYRSGPLKDYLGAYFYCPVSLLTKIKEKSTKKLVIILNEKDVNVSNARAILEPCIGLIDMVRMAIDPKNFERAILLAEEVKEMGFEIGFNVMYMSKWKYQSDFLKSIGKVDGLADYFYMVDSYGGVFPADVRETYDLVRSESNVKIGFHGHNNMEMALINSLTAMECGAEMIDATVTGMGRGAGNLKTELLLTALNQRDGLDVNFNALSEVVDSFEELQKEYAWGTNLPYMVSGANSLPQKDVMEWVSKRYFSFNSIIRALQNQKDGKKDNQELKTFAPTKTFKKAIVIGGGKSSLQHIEGIKEFIGRQNGEICIIHASSKNAAYYEDIRDIEQYFCLVGSEGHRLEKVFSTFKNFHGTCILPPFPRKMGTYVPSSVMDMSFELAKSEIDYPLNDTHTILALQTAIELKVEELYLVGYDGYPKESISTKEHELFIENQSIFNSLKGKLNLTSIVPTTYEIKSKAVYSFLV
jgi:4-hydroxy 2-oxovalerate aldolase